MPSACWGQGAIPSPSPLITESQPLLHLGGQWGNLGSPGGDRQLGEGKLEKKVHPRVQIPSGHRQRGWGRGGKDPSGLTSSALPLHGGYPQHPPSPAPSTDDPSSTRQGPRQSQGHGCRSIATVQESRPRLSRRVNKRYHGAPTPPRAAPGTDPGAGAGALGGRQISAGRSAASPGAGAPRTGPRGRDPLRKAGGGDGDPEAQRPYPEPRSQPEGLAVPAPAVLSLQEGGPPIARAGAVHRAPAVRQCGTGAGGAGGGGREGCRVRGRARARQGRERRMRRGSELQRRRRDAPGGSASCERKTGGGGGEPRRDGEREAGKREGGDGERDQERKS